MSKMPHFSKYHSNTILITFINRILVFNRTTWLNDCLNTSFMCFFYTIREWKEGIRC